MPEKVDSAPTENTVVANLKLHYPQLVGTKIQIGLYTSTGIDGLRLGKIDVDGQQSQDFLIGSNDKIYLLASNPIAIIDYAAAETKLEQRRLKEKQALAEQKQQLADAINRLPIKGNPDADLILVEFSDFQCPYCAEAAGTIRQLMERHGDKVRFALLDFPLDSIHPWARKASIATVCAANQSDAAYWTLHDFYFEHQDSITESNLLADSRQQLSHGDIDIDQWENCASDVTSKSHLAAAEKVKQALALGDSLGVNSTPTFFFNGKMLNGAPTLNALETLIENAQADLEQ